MEVQSDIVNARTQSDLGTAVPHLLALITTTRSLLLLDLSTKQVTPIEWDRPEYYGVSWFPGVPHLVLSHSNLDNASLTGLADYAMSEVGTVSLGDALSPPFLSQPHQLLCAPDGRIVCTNTGRNAISVYDFDRPNTFQEVRVSSNRWDRLSPEQTIGDHLNSVFIQGQRLYALAHGFANGSRLIELDYPSLEIVDIRPVHSCTGMHNVWVSPAGERICCDSDSGSLVDIDRGQVLWATGSSTTFTRGLAATSNMVLVGESEKIGRNLRLSSMSGLWLLDRDNWKAIDYFCLGPYGSVHEVRVLNVADEAHHGHPFSGLEALLHRDARVELTIDRSAAASRWYDDHQAWKSFQTVYGQPIAGENESRTAAAGELCLLIQPASAGRDEWEMSFRYSIDPAVSSAHVSVVSYRGQGGDTDMEALLIQRQHQGEGALMSRWTHDGRQWQQKPGEFISGLPLQASAKASLRGSSMDLIVDNQRVFSLPLNTSHHSASAVGLRFTGATIYPCV